MGPGLLLLLLLPWGVLGNVGGSAGACSCTHRWSREPPPGMRLSPLARHVLRAELCPNHIRRFVLPHKWRLCGLQDSPWVAELLHLWERQVAQRALAGPLAAGRPTDGSLATNNRPTDRPPAEDGPPARPPASPLAPLSPPAPVGHPPGPTVRHSLAPSSRPASRLGEGHGYGTEGQLPGGPQALLPTPAGWIHWEAMGQDPQTPPPAVGPAPLSVGLAVGLMLLGASLGLGLACRRGCWGAGKGREPGPPPHPEALLSLSCPMDVGYGPCEVP